MQPTTPESTVSTRRMKVLDKAFARRRGRYAFFPCICLSGKWLADQGFASGSQIDIACEAGKLVITVTGAPAS